MSEVLLSGFFEGMPWEVDDCEIDPHAINGIQAEDGDVHIEAIMM